MHLNIKKFGRKKKTLDEESVKLILEVHKEPNLGARRLKKGCSSAWSLMIVRGALSRAGSSMPKQKITPYSF